MPLKNGAILFYVWVYEYFHLRQISKHLRCYSPKMQTYENLSWVEFSDASNFAKLPVSSKAVYDAVTEVSHNACGLYSRKVQEI